jgi:glutamate synthase domain-containing protein 3
MFALRRLDFSALLAVPKGEIRRWMGPKHAVRPEGESFDGRFLELAGEVAETGAPVRRRAAVRNTERAVGAGISSRIVRRRGPGGLPDDTFVLDLYGTAGQSFGAFAARGVTLNLWGDANDYVGKGLSGGRVAVRPPQEAPAGFVPRRNTIAGNVALYGATSGELYLCGRAGERFAVRNSGALAVVEGVGDHGCEYMTGGRVAILGQTGVNFAAGMSGGLAYVYDEDGMFDSRCNLEMVDLDPLAPADEQELKTMIENHVRYTGSAMGRRILAGWNKEKGRFVKVIPMEYRRILAGPAGTAPEPGQGAPGEPFLPAGATAARNVLPA